jgi:rhodanese-related sulfurtransferase
VHDKLLALPDATKVFPAHGAGSACGKSLSTETVSTIGEQRRTNYALQPMGIDEFVAAVTEGQTSAPAYFGYNAGLNKADRELLDADPPRELTLDEVIDAQASGATVVDTRGDVEFAQGHLIGSVNVGQEGRYAEYVGTVVPPGTPIVVVTEPGDEREAKLRLARIGFDTVVGALAGGAPTLAERPDLVTPSSRLTVAQLQERLGERSVQLVDIRNPGEVALGMIPGAELIPLAELRGQASRLRLDEPIVLYCAGGYRSSIAASLLQSMGAPDVSDLLGGYTAWMTTAEGVTA